jgi:hypothetical protein
MSQTSTWVSHAGEREGNAIIVEEELVCCKEDSCLYERNWKNREVGLTLVIKKIQGKKTALERQEGNWSKKEGR